MEEIFSFEETENVQEELSNDVKRLKQAWINEKVCPELLPYEHEVVENLLEQVENQQNCVAEGASENIHNAFIANIYQMEIDRLNYILRSYLRIRLWKIEQYAIHTLKEPAQRNLLSAHELKYAKEYIVNMENHLRECCLKDLPESFQTITLQNDAIDMIPAPDLNIHVFCRINEPIGDFELVDDEGDDADIVSLQEGDLYILRYKPIIPLLKENKIALL